MDRHDLAHATPAGKANLPTSSQQAAVSRLNSDRTRCPSSSSPHVHDPHERPHRDYRHPRVKDSTLPVVRATLFYRSPRRVVWSDHGGGLENVGVSLVRARRTRLQSWSRRRKCCSHQHRNWPAVEDRRHRTLASRLHVAQIRPHMGATFPTSSRALPMTSQGLPLPATRTPGSARLVADH